MNDVVRSLLNIATVQHIVQQNINYCTTLDNMYNIVQNLVQFPFQTHFSVVQLFKLFMEYKLYNLLYNIVQLMYNVVQYCTGCTGCTTFCTML